jgi:hypothetical protein
MSDTLYVATADRSRTAECERIYELPFAITGTLKVRAKSADDAWRKAIRVNVLDLAVIGDLEMDQPEDQGAVQ